MLTRVSRAAIYALVIFPVVLPAYGLTSQEVVAKLRNDSRKDYDLQGGQRREGSFPRH
jgi:hypothetical protein